MPSPAPRERPSALVFGSASTVPQAGLAERIDAALPQTQCTRCGHPDCRAYAEAIAAGRAGINQCPPGGAEGIARLAAITGLTPTPLNPEHGTEAPRRLAVIDEAWCIGCTLCIQACPVDAIAGAPKRMHSVLADWCTGCELCLPPCPMDCIELQPLPDEALAGRTGWAAWSAAQAQAAQQRYAARQQRKNLAERERHNAPHGREMENPPDRARPFDAPSGSKTAEQQRKQALVAAALERARQRQAERRR